MPTSATSTYTGSGLQPSRNPEEVGEYAVTLPASVTYASGTILGQISATGVFKAYTSGASDGSQIPKAILKHSVITDASGNIGENSTVGTTGNDAGITTKYTDAYHKGTFFLADLTAGVGIINATALTNQPSWHLISGDLATSLVVGEIRLG